MSTYKLELPEQSVIEVLNSKKETLFSDEVVTLIELLLVSQEEGGDTWLDNYRGTLVDRYSLKTLSLSHAKMISLAILELNEAYKKKLDTVLM